MKSKKDCLGLQSLLPTGTEYCQLEKILSGMYKKPPTTNNGQPRRVRDCSRNPFCDGRNKKITAESPTRHKRGTPKKSSKE